MWQTQFKQGRCVSRRVGGVLAVTVAILCGVLVTAASARATSSASISTVVFGGTLPTSPRITVNGSGFGAVAPAPNPSETPCAQSDKGFDYGTFFYLMNLTEHWDAGRNDPAAGAFACIGLVIETWTDTQVVFHFDGFYTEGGYKLQQGDAIQIIVAGARFGVVVPDPHAGERVSGVGSPGTSFDWDFPSEPSGGWSRARLDVTVTRAPLRDADAFYYYASQWTMDVPTAPGGSVVSYMGIQTQGQRPDGTLGPFALVTLFSGDNMTFFPGKGTDGHAAKCYTELDGAEGSIATCRIAYGWHQGHVYRYKFARTGPRRWTATITDRSVPGTPVTTLGTFLVPPAWRGIQNLAAGFLEQYITPPETSRATNPVCPSHRTTAQFVSPRLDDTTAPLHAYPRVYDLNNGTWQLVCQNATVRTIPDGVRLDTNIPTPAPAKPARLGRRPHRNDPLDAAARSDNHHTRRTRGSAALPRTSRRTCSDHGTEANELRRHTAERDPPKRRRERAPDRGIQPDARTHLSLLDHRQQRKLGIAARRDVDRNPLTRQRERVAGATCEKHLILVDTLT